MESFDLRNDWFDQRSTAFLLRPTPEGWAGSTAPGDHGFDLRATLHGNLMAVDAECLKTPALLIEHAPGLWVSWGDFALTPGQALAIIRAKSVLVGLQGPAGVLSEVIPLLRGGRVAGLSVCEWKQEFVIHVLYSLHSLAEREVSR